MTAKRDLIETSKLEEDAALTDALKDTFPASDPVSMTQPHGGRAQQTREGAASGTEAVLSRSQVGDTDARHRRSDDG